MPATFERDRLKKFFNNLEDKPLDPTDAFYYPFLAESDDDPIAELAGRISFSQSQSVNLFIGQRGCGKSTEFRRLQAMLVADGCEVFLLDMRDYMNLTTPVEISDFLISIMVALSEAVESRYQQSPHSRGYVERIVDVLNKDLKLEVANIVGIKASLKDDPSFKQLLQQGLKGHVARIVKDAHSFAQEVVQLIRDHSHDDKKVVVLVDSVEQLRGVGAAGSSEMYKSVENLFSGHADSLQIPMLHIVYTIPPYLTPLAPGLGRQLGSNLGCTLPCIHVQTKDNQTDPAGLAILRELVKRRCPEWQSVFNEQQLNELGEASGGDLRDFFRLIRDCLVKASTRNENEYAVSDKVIMQTLNHSRREMLPIAEKDKLWLAKIHDTKEAELESIERLPELARFFDTKLVLNYRNGDDWYDVHPLLRDELGG